MVVVQRYMVNINISKYFSMVVGFTTTYAIGAYHH